MTNKVTKVKLQVKNKMRAVEEPGWNSVLGDLNTEIESLQELAVIVKRKIRHGEPWPGTATPLRTQSVSQSEQPATQC